MYGPFQKDGFSSISLKDVHEQSSKSIGIQVWVLNSHLGSVTIGNPKSNANELYKGILYAHPKAKGLAIQTKLTHDLSLLKF